MKKHHFFFLTLLTLLLVACASGNPGGSNTNASLTPPPVNGFGTAQNHVHSLVILPDAHQTMVLATHYGIFRSQDHGATWQKTAGGPGQQMQGVMAWWLSYNPLDPQRLYLLTFYQTGTIPRGSTLGLYTSGDGGQTWQLSTADASVTSSTITWAWAGNDNPSEVYIYLSNLGPLGLRVSGDNGQHFTQAGSPLPFGGLHGLLPIPGQPDHLLIYSDNGVASTSDGGSHWKVISNIQGSIFEMTTPGPNGPIYAEGDAGIYVSQDGGQSFSLVYTQHSFSSLTASPAQPHVVYGKLGLGVYRSTDGGHSWSALPTIQGNLQVLVVDPNNANQVYLALSYPAEVYHFQQANKTWQSLTPPV
jgi:photosystem II stability/assembly factor-like uncharacterized protein